MSSIPARTPNRVRGPGAPNVPSVNNISAENLGAGIGRQLQQLGQAGERASLQIMAQQQRIEERKIQAAVNDELSLYSQAQAKARTDLQQKVGREASDTPDTLISLSEDNAMSSIGRLQSEYAKRIFNERRQNIDAQNNAAMYTHMVQQTEFAYNESIDANISDAIERVTLNAGNMTILRESLNEIEELTRERYRGHAREEIDRQVQSNKIGAIEGYSQRLAAALGAQAALEFLETDLVEGLKDGQLAIKIDQMRAKYRDGAESQAAFNKAHDDFLAGKTANEREYFAYNNPEWADKPDLRDEYLAISKRLFDNVESEIKTAQARSKDEFFERFISEGLDVTKLTPEEHAENSAAIKEVIAYQKVLQSAGEDLAPDYPELRRVYSMTPEQIRDYIDEPGGYARLKIAAGPDNKFFEDILNKGNVRGEEGALEGVGKVSRPNPPIDLNRLYPSLQGIFSTEGAGPLGIGAVVGWRNPRQYTNSKSDRLRQKQFEAYFTEQYGKAFIENNNADLNYEDARQLAITSAQYIRDNPGTLERYVIGTELDLDEVGGNDTTVTARDLTPAQHALDQGEEKVLRHFDDGNSYTFGIVPSESDIVPDMIRTVPGKKEILRTYDSGSIKGIPFNPGDYIVNFNGVSHVFNEAWEYKQGAREPLPIPDDQSALDAESISPAVAAALDRKASEWQMTNGANTATRIDQYGRRVVVSTYTGREIGTANSRGEAVRAEEWASRNAGSMRPRR